MLPKKSRLSTLDVEEVFKSGRFMSTPSFTFKYILRNSGIPQISVVAPKSVAKLAVKRNSLRRKGYNAIAKYMSGFPPLLGVLVFKNPQNDPAIITHEINTILGKFN